MGVRPEKRKLKGIEKVSILLMSLPEEIVGNIMKEFDTQEIRGLCETMMELGQIKPKVIESTFVEFTNELASTSSLYGSVENTERLLQRVLPFDQAMRILEEVKGPAGKTVWDKIRTVNEDVLANFLKNEYPQTIALVLSKIPPENTARVLSLFPQSLALEVIDRMIGLEPVRKEILAEVEETLRNEFMSSFSKGTQQDNHQLIAEIFNNLDNATESMMMEQLQLRSPRAAELVKSFMFTFEDLSELDDATIQTLLRRIDKSKLALALKGASERLRVLFFKNLSERASRLLAEDMQTMGMVKLRDVEDAQNMIISVAKEMAESGSIFISTKSNPSNKLVG